MILVAAGCGGAGGADGQAGFVSSEQGHFEGRFSPDSTPIELQQIHSWTLELRDGDGAPVRDARIAIQGGMPAHQHGLPTVPEVAGEVEPGRYRVDGIKFSMKGLWVFRLQVWAGALSDEVVWQVELP
ncbi:hypothetical protein ABI59_08415 [Acidobacteria bacterium Mor1]|nr:hypothetical protein ABI59_08415 [Acidobacteria bacterium Mor1]